MTFSNFTQKARQAISNAHDIACEMGHYYIGSEHLLLGLIKEGTGVAAKALTEQGVTNDNVIEKLKELVGIKSFKQYQSGFCSYRKTKRRGGGETINQSRYRISSHSKKQKNLGI